MLRSKSGLKVGGSGVRSFKVEEIFGSRVVGEVREVDLGFGER